jgi:hypothetical protein
MLTHEYIGSANISQMVTVSKKEEGPGENTSTLQLRFVEGTELGLENVEILGDTFFGFPPLT